MKRSDLMRPESSYEAVIKQREIDGNAFGIKYADAFVAVPCPACGQEGEAVFEKYHFQHRLCGGCKTLFCSPRPSEELLSIFYNDYLAPQMWTELLLQADVARKTLQYRPRVEKITSVIKDNGGYAGGVAVDVGAGSGAFSLCLKESGFFSEVIALDLSRFCVQACQKQGLKTHLGQVKELANSFADFICMNDLFEHVFDPLVLLKQCYAVLKPGGFVSIATPNGEGFDFKILKGKTGNITPPEHLTYFNPSSLSALFKKAGFETIYAQTPGKLDVEIILKAKTRGFSVKKNNEYLDFILEQEESVLENFQNFLAENKLSSHMLVIARKESL
jgi:2-polyprenyl-3-methyl-5-hydroxy-6-metoxy-1,4-benzoquinol methylase